MMGITLTLGLLFYTQSLIRTLREENRETISLYAQVIADAVTSPDIENLDFIFREIIQKVSFPLIQSDKDGNPVNWKNLTSRDESDLESVRNTLERMNKNNDPIPLKITLPKDGGKIEKVVLGHIHYGDSKLIRQLQFLPYIEIGAVFLFIFLGYAGFQVIRKNEKNHIWFGMSRETAHQLGTPISSLMGWIETIKEFPDKTTGLITDMENDLNRLEVINDRFSKMGSLPKKEKVKVNELLSETLTYFEHRLPKRRKNIHLSLESAEGEIRVNTSKTLLAWAVENIIKNALDSIQHKKGFVKLNLNKVDGKVVIKISDSGQGIDKRDWKNIFRPGYSTKERGWGLGLSLTKRICEEYLDGNVKVLTSEIGKGTVFEISLQSN